MALHWPFISIVLPTAAIGLLLSVPLALACCNDVVPPSVEPPERATYSPNCSVAFSPDGASRPAFEMAAARWSVTMGCEVTEGEGVPISATRLLFVEYDASGYPTLYPDNPGRTRKPLCGISIWNAALTNVESIHVALEDVACTAEDAVTHELGHSLSKLRRHAVDGIMARGGTRAWSPLITEQSLALACAGTACSRFSPEDQSPSATGSGPE